MPELPEVEVICQGLAPLIAEKTIIGMGHSGHALRLPVPVTAIDQLIVGQQVRGTTRRAKYLIIEMGNRARLIFHLGMSGRIGLFKRHENHRRHDHLSLLFEDDMELRFNDTRRFGSVQVFSHDTFTRKNPFIKLGPEPFDANFSAEYLFSRAAGRSKPVKNFLMDNAVVVGIGNIYVCETLFSARIAPQTPAGALTIAQWQRIIKKLRTVLHHAIQCGGTTIADFVNTRGEAGSFQVELNVYGRKNKPCPRCMAPIARIVMAGRGTFFCPACQPKGHKDK